MILFFAKSANYSLINLSLTHTQSTLAGTQKTWQRPSSTPNYLSLIPQCHKTTLTHPNRLPDSQSGDFTLKSATFRTKHLTTIATVMFPFVQCESDTATGAVVCAFVFQPVVSGAAAWHVTDTPGEDASSGIAHVNCAMVPRNVLSVSKNGFWFLGRKCVTLKLPAL